MARLVEIISRPGFENFFDEASSLFQGVPDPGKIKELAARYHTTLGWDEWVPERTKKYKLKLFEL